MLENIVFLYPWILLTGLFIPILLWILRFMPPKPRLVEFPALFLLKGLDNKTMTPARTSWVMLLLRSLLLLLFILAFAEPVYNPSQEIAMPKKGAILIAVDNGWQSAANWQVRQKKLEDYLNQAKREDVNVLLLETARTKDDIMRNYGLMPADAGIKVASSITPEAWASDYTAASEMIDKLKREIEIGKTILMSSGSSADNEFLNKFDVIVNDDEINKSYVLKTETKNDKGLELSLEALKSGEFDTQLSFSAFDASGNIIDALKVTFPSGQKVFKFKWDMLPDFMKKLASVRLSTYPSASASVYYDTSRNSRMAGIIVNHKPEAGSHDLLKGSYYVFKALEKSFNVEADKLDVLLKGGYSALILSDDSILTAEDRQSLQTWVESGGLLVRFAGPNMASSKDDVLLPVHLRSGERSTSGSMTWQKPLKLAPIAQDSPLYGLNISDDIEVKSQVLAEPGDEVFNHTWLQLEDGTPLITSAAKGKGNIVLVHSSADPQWSNFCYSGLFVEVLQRLVMMSSGASGNFAVSGNLKPFMIIDALGNAQSADGRSILKPLVNGESFSPKPSTPAGIYGDNYNFKVFNLGENLGEITALDNIPAKSQVVGYGTTGELHLKSFIIKIALLILLLETCATLWYRGALIAFIGLLFILPHNAMADSKTENFNPVDQIYLAYVETGDVKTDKLSYNGLKGLANVINSRTAVRIAGIIPANLEKSQLAYYPFIYWPMSEKQAPISQNAATNLQNYISNGGLVVFDTRDQQIRNNGINRTEGIEKMREIASGITIPELVKVPENNILRRSFYILDKFPGLYDGGDVWIEKEPSPANDSVPSIVIGSVNWAAAWSDDPEDDANYFVQPGGEEQREEAYKFGINLLMVGLTGNYKADQVHVNNILDRMEK